MKMCDNCGCVMNENTEVCPNCGYHENNQNNNGFEPPQDSPNNNSLDIPFQDDFQKMNKKQDPILQETSSFQEVNPFEGLSYPVVTDLPKLKNESDIPDIVTRHAGIEPQSYFNYNNTANTTSVSNNQKSESSSRIAMVAIVLVLAIGGGFFLFKILSPKEDFDTNDNQKIKLTDVEDPKDTSKDKEDEEQTKPDPKPTEDPNENPENPSEVEKPKEVLKKVGQFTLSIPSNYVISSYQDVGITITEPTNGRTMTFIQGVYDISSYRSKKEELIEQMESGGTKVNKTYNTVINNQDLFVMELIEEQVSYLMFVVPIKNTSKTLLVMAADHSNPHNFNYEIIKDALSIIENVK